MLQLLFYKYKKFALFFFPKHIHSCEILNEMESLVLMIDLHIIKHGFSLCLIKLVNELN